MCNTDSYAVGRRKVKEKPLATTEKKPTLHPNI
jgi:hypothetical protein